MDPEKLKADLISACDFLQKIIDGERLFMKIPAHEGDYDLVFSRVIKAAAAAIELQDALAVAEKALKGLSDMYTHAWDLVDGGLMMMEGSIPKFEDAHEGAVEALQKITAMREGSKP